MKKQAGILAGLMTAAGIVTAAVYRYAFFFSKKQRANIGYPKEEQYESYRKLSEELIGKVREQPFEEAVIYSEDGLRLYGKYYHMADKAPVEILFHGYHGMAERDFCGGFWLAREAGHNVLLVDERAHGNSEGHVITFGIRERYDCLGWIRYAIERFGKDVQIVLVGVSMGAAAVLMASDLGLPENVKGIIADCSYSSPKAIIRKRIREIGFPARLPVLLIHGEADQFVPCEMSWENYRACAAEKRIFTVPGAGHALCYMVDTEGYRKAVKEFLDQYVGEPRISHGSF